MKFMPWSLLILMWVIIFSMVTMLYLAPLFNIILLVMGGLVTFVVAYMELYAVRPRVKKGSK